MSTRPKDLQRSVFDGYKPPPLNRGGGQTVWTKDKEDEIITRIEQGLGRNLQSMEGGPFSNENGEFHVSGWAQTLGIDAVAEQMLKAKSAGWDRVKVIAHLDSLAAGKTRDNYQKPKETAVIISLVEDPHWIAVRDKHIDENPAAKSWLGVAVRSVYVNEKTVKIRMTSRTGVEQVQGYVSRLTELFKMQKPGIEIVEVGL